MIRTAEHPAASVHQTTRWIAGPWRAPSYVIMIGRLTPVWITAERPVNEYDTRHAATRLSDLLVHATAYGIVVAGSEIRVVRMEALHPPRGAPYTSARTVPLSMLEGPISLPRVPRMRFIHRTCKLRVRFDLALCLAHTTSRLDPRDTAVRQGTREPVPGREGLTRIEDGRYFSNDGQTQIAPATDGGGRSQRPPDLEGEHVTVGRRRHDTRMRSLTSVQYSDSPTTSTIMTDSAAARSARAPDPRSRAHMSSAMASRVASSARARAK